MYINENGIKINLESVRCVCTICGNIFIVRWLDKPDDFEDIGCLKCGSGLMEHKVDEQSCIRRQV